MKKQITIFEVGPRDGLQNESRPLAYAQRSAFIRSLARAGLRDIEVGAFVHPDRVPKMAESPQIAADIRDGKINLGKARGWFLVPNAFGLRRAQELGCKNIAIFTAASETFVRRNINQSIAESLKNYQVIVKEARAQKMRVRAYISTAFACPFEGKIKPAAVHKVTGALLKMGCYQVSIGDTIGIGTPKDVDKVFAPALKNFGSQAIACHFHDTRGTALANALRSWELGVSTFDSSAGGLGGCPFAPGATGNLATEDLVFMMDGMGVKTGVDLQTVADASIQLAEEMQRPLASRYVTAYKNQCQEPAYQMDW